MPTKWTHPIALWAILILSLTGWTHGAQAAGVAAELESAPVLSGCEPDYPPYCIVTADQQADGFSVELLRAALKAVGREVSFKTGSWAEIKQDLADGRVEALPLVGRTPEREAIYDFTFPYLTMHGTLVVREDNTGIRGPDDLKGKQVAVLQGDNAEEYLRRAGLGAIIVPLPSFETALRELSSGKYDAVVIQKLLAFQLMGRAGIVNLKAVGPPLQDFAQSFCFAVRKGNGALLARLNEGLTIVMADGTFRRLYAKWFSAIEAMSLTKSRIVIGGDDNYPPYEFLDKNGQPAGFNVDLTKAIARKLGLAVEIRLGPWGKIRKGLESGSIDMVQGMFYSTERDKQFAFSPPYTLVQHSVVVRQGSPEPSSMASLAGKSILVMAGDIMHDLALESGYGKQLVIAVSQEEALRRLATGEGDCALVAEVPALYWIEKHGWSNLRICAPPVLSAEYCYAVPRGDESLLPRFSEGLSMVKRSGEFRKIQSRWLAPYEPSHLSLLAVTKYALAILLPLVALLIGSLLWSRSLREQVISRTRELSAEIAERRLGEEALREANVFTDSIIENIPNMVFLKDAKELRFIRFNRAGEDLLGLSRDSLLGKNDYDFFPKEQAERFQAKDREVLGGTQIVDVPEEPLQSPTMGARTLHTKKVPLFNSNGEPEYLLGISEDITERKAAEEALLASQEKYRSILENIEEGYYEVDLEGTLLFANEAFYGILGWTKEEMPGANYRDHMRPEKAEATFRVFNEVFRTGKPARAADWEMIHRDGSLKAIEASVTPIQVSEGRLSGFRGMIRDITERKRAEDALLQAKEHYQSLVETLGEGVAITDLGETFLFANPAGESIFGIPPGSLVGRNLREFLPGEEFERVEEGTRQRVKGIAGTYEIRITRPDGQVRDLRVTATPMRDNDGAYAATLAVFSDVTNQKRADQVLRLSELEREKTRGSELLAQLIQGLAHEIRNPLFAININAAVLERKAGASPGVAESVGFVKEHVARLDSLMRDLLDLGRQPTAGERVDCRVRDLTNAAILAVETEVPEASGRTLVEAPEARFTLPAFPDRLKRVLVLLIENALQNSPPKSRVTVRVSRAGGEATVEVIDAGSGIPGKIRERLFEPFVTTHTGRRGLGLALAKHFTESMGGKIEAADNEPGPGATFTVRLPVGRS